MIYYKDGVKMMRPVHTREEYLALRNGGEQQDILKAVRGGDASRKSRLVQMNYSCLPNDDGTLKGSKRMSSTVGMDVDWTPSPLPHEGEEQIAARKEEWLKKVPEMVALGLLMLERSASKGFHLVFRRRPELNQEDNLRWASDLLGVEYDKGAKDITRVFFTTTEKELLFLDDEIFSRPTPLPLPVMEGSDMSQGQKPSTPLPTSKGSDMSQGQKPSTPLTHREGTGEGLSFPTHYHGIPFTDIIAKYWEVNNRGFEPTQGDRDTLTYQLACDLRHICGRNFEWLDQVIPCYDGFPIEEKRAKIKSALASEFNGFPLRLRNVLNSLTPDPGLTPNPSPKGEGSEEPDTNESPLFLEGVRGRLPMGIRGPSVGNAGGDGRLPLYRHAGNGCDAGRARSEEGTEPYLLYRR